MKSLVLSLFVVCCFAISAPKAEAGPLCRVARAAVRVPFRAVKKVASVRPIRSAAKAAGGVVRRSGRAVRGVVRGGCSAGACAGGSCK